MSGYASGDHPLPFNEAFQEAVVGHCLVDSRFFLKCYNRLKPQWFSKNMLLGTIFSQLSKHYQFEGNFITSLDEFKNSSFFLEQTPADRDKYYSLIDKCALLSARNFRIDGIEMQLTGFLRVSMFKESVEGAAQRYKTQGFDDAYKWTKRRLDEIGSASFEDNEFEMSFDLPLEWITQQEIRRTNAISTGSAVLDAALGGGLFRKETCAFMAPSNVGKTTGMITIARNALIKNQKVMFIIHEGSPEEIRFRLLCSFIGISTATMFEWTKDPTKQSIIKGAANFLKGNLTYVPYIKTNSMFVEDLVDFVKKKNEEEKVRTGRGYDLIIDDYPKKLKSKLRSGSKEGLYRVEAAEIYDTFNHLATELDAHVFVAVQTNRTGLKQNNGRIENDRLLGMEEIDEAYGIAQNLANIITLNRSPDDRTRNILRMNIAKSRNQMTDIAINTRTKYDCFLTFADKEFLPAIWPNDIPHGFLAAYAQTDNRKEDVDTVDNALRGIESLAEDTKDSRVGIANLGGKLE